MANVNLVVCTTTPNLTTTTYSSWCPSANRRIIVVDDIELAAAAKAKKDLDRLLKASAFWDTPGR